MTDRKKFLMDMFEMHISYIMDEYQEFTYDEAHAFAWEQGRAGLLNYLHSDINKKSELASALGSELNVS